MRNRMLAVLALLGVGGLTCSLGAQPAAEGMDRAIREAFDLSRISVQRLDPPAENVPFLAELSLGGVGYGVWIEPASFRAEDARATTMGPDGRLVEIDLPAPLSVRGQVEGVPEARAAGSRMGGGLHLTIVLPGAEQAEVWSVQPLSDAIEGADPALHVVHRADDIVPDPRWRCGVEDHGPAHEDLAGDAGAGTRAFLVCEMAADGDYDFYVRNGSSEANTIADIDTVVARVSAVYEGQCNVTFQVPHYQIWTTSADPYTSTDPGTRLEQFRNWWEANMGAVHRDLCHGFTGVDINGGVIGIAWLSAVCGSNGYGLVQSRFTINMNQRGALSAHEIGHNFSAGHCDGSGDCHIMCSGLGGCDGLGNPAYFGAASAVKITNYAANRSCLDIGGPAYPFLEQWPTTTIDPTVWAVNNGCAVLGDADNEPSEPYALNLDGTDSIELDSLDLSGVSEPPYLILFTQHKGVEAGKTLTVEYRDFLGNWNALATVTSDGEDQTAFFPRIVGIPVTGWSDLFSIRLSAQGADSSDDWYVDEISIDAFAGIPTPLLETFPASDLDSLLWSSVVGAASSTDATNEPSEPYALNLDGGDSVQSAEILMGHANFPSYISFYTQHKGVESGETLLVEYYDFTGAWAILTTLASDGADQNSFQFFQTEMPLFAYHDGFLLRFTAVGGDGTDDWYVDDLRIGDEFTPPDDCLADFNGDGTIDALDFLAFLNAFSSADPRADVNGDGSINGLDFLEFLNLWNAGC